MLRLQISYHREPIPPQLYNIHSDKNIDVLINTQTSDNNSCINSFLRQE